MNKILNQTRNPLEIAELLKISAKRAKEMVKDCQEELPGWGKLSLQPHIISRRHVNYPWPGDHRGVIEYNQRLHDQGKVTMCQGRDGAFFILYAVPNERIVKRQPYFFVDRGY